MQKLFSDPYQLLELLLICINPTQMLKIYINHNIPDILCQFNKTSCKIVISSNLLVMFYLVL